MKIKKYQNPSGTLTPEREAEIRAEQQAALNELWEKRNAYAKQEEQERKQQLKEEIKRITSEVAAKTAHLDNGSSATDYYYAFQDDPQKRAEWDKGAKLTTLAGMGAVATPYILSGLGSMGGVIYKGLNNPITRTAVQQAGTKAALSTLAGEAIDKFSNDGRTFISNSDIQGTKLGKTLNAGLIALPFLDVDGKLVNLAESGVKHIDNWSDGMSMFEKANNNELTRELASAIGEHKRILNKSKTKNEHSLSKLSDIEGRLARPDINDGITIDLFNEATKTFGDDFFIEAFPSHSEYFDVFDPSIRSAAQKAFEREMASGQGLIANGILSRASGSEIATRGLAKQQGFGNNGIILVRAMPQSELLHIGTSGYDDALRSISKNPDVVEKYMQGLPNDGKIVDKPLYTMFSDPGIVDKYIITPRGTSLKDMGIDKQKYLAAYIELEHKRQSFENMLRKGIARGDRTLALRGARGLMWSNSVMPSTIQHHNILSSMGDYYDNDEAGKMMSDTAKKIGSDLMEKMKKGTEKLYNSGLGPVLAGEVPILDGITKEYHNLPVYAKESGRMVPLIDKGSVVTETRGVYPILVGDNADIMSGPDIKIPFNPFAGPAMDQLDVSTGHGINGFKHRLNMLYQDPHEAQGIPDLYVKLAGDTAVGGQMASGVFHFSGDSTAKSGLLPSISIVRPSEGQFKHMTPYYRTNGQFRVVPGLKIGGTIPSYLKIFKRK